MTISNRYLLNSTCLGCFLVCLAFVVIVWGGFVVVGVFFLGGIWLFVFLVVVCVWVGGSV